NAVSGGRAEVILGRGSSIESFQLFGYDLADYEELFEEKAALFAELRKGGPVTWDGKTRAPLLNQDVVPHTESGPFPAWGGVGGVGRALPAWGSLSCARSGAGRGPVARRTRPCPSAPWKGPPARRSRWACTRRATSRPPTGRRRRSSGRAGGTSSRSSPRS